ncbi:PH domain containing protein [Tritrichomonas foetus]|uniref:PH domain containing protein n=1 Tax=Tritrichomonas foetus TaxID=1144522 RepID=A0A1J4JLQ4_9EUKA|nr:PH domain containing protein [Tritrichomonas foetus]|eukprot:OHS98477.1 PH domain containing protein [Tritrichomonas foetus]
MTRMEGFLMKKGWFNNWKMRYVTCSERVLAIYKTKGDDKTGNTFNVIDCNIKRIDAKRWNRKFVFRLKVAGKRIYLAAEDENSLNKWISVIRGRVERESLLGANAIRAAQCDKRRSTLVSLSRADCQQLISFQPSHLVESYNKAIKSSTDPEAQFKFAETCGEFLAIAHSQGQGLFQLNEIKPIKGLNARFISKEERRKVLKQMKSIAHIFSLHNPDILLPLQCLIDYTGRTLFLEVQVEGDEELNDENNEKLVRLGLDTTQIKAIQDKDGNLWIMEALADIPTATDKEITEFVKCLDNMQMFVFDSQSLSEQMRTHKIPVSKLPQIAEMTTIPSIRVLIQIEMIARTCKHIISDRLAEVEKIQWTREIIKHFDLVLGNNEESDQFWDKTLTPKIQEKFGVELTKQLPMLHMPQLFFSLQFHTGADFKDISDYDFTQEHPVLLEHLSSINSVPHHFLVEICTSLREIAEDPYKQLTNGFYNNAMLALNNKVSLFQSIYGDENIFVASGLSQLSQAYLGLGYIDKAELCARGAIGAGRHFHAALIPAYITLISTCQENEIDKYTNEALQIVNFQLSDSHWFEADILMASASAHQNVNQLQKAAKLAQNAVEIVHPLLGPGHPKTARCGLLQGRIHRMMRQFAVAQPLIQQALYAMTAAFGPDSVQTAECEFELADALLDSGKSEESEQEAMKAYQIRKSNFEADNSLVIDCVQQLAVIYDTMNEPDKAFNYYRILINFLKRLEDETIFEEMVKVMRNILCLFFRSIGISHIQTVNLLRRKHIEVEEMKGMFQKLIDHDPIDLTKNLFEKYQKAGEQSDFDSLASIYHIAMDDMSTLTWLEEH